MSTQDLINLGNNYKILDKKDEILREHLEDLDIDTLEVEFIKIVATLRICKMELSSRWCDKIEDYK